MLSVKIIFISHFCNLCYNLFWSIIWRKAAYTFVGRIFIKIWIFYNLHYPAPLIFKLISTTVLILILLLLTLFSLSYIFWLLTSLIQFLFWLLATLFSFNFIVSKTFQHIFRLFKYNILNNFLSNLFGKSIHERFKHNNLLWVFHFNWCICLFYLTSMCSICRLCNICNLCSSNNLGIGWRSLFGLYFFSSSRFWRSWFFGVIWYCFYFFNC